MHSDDDVPLPAAGHPAGGGWPVADASTGGDDAGPEAPPAPVHRLPALCLPDNAALVAAVQRLVDQKRELDRLVRDGRVAGIVPPAWRGQAPRALDMAAFVQSVLPFLQPAGRGDTASLRLPLAHVLGDSGRWGHAQVSEPRSLAWFLASDERAGVGNGDVAEAFVVAALGLAWMQEGRSRVEFLRSAGEASLAARTTMLAYPAAGQLSLHAVTVHGQPEVWCVLAGRRVQALLAPWLSVPLLVAYGVAAPQPWPSTLPAVAEVARALVAARQGRVAPEIDLGRVARRIAEQVGGEIWQPVSLLQLRTWAPRWGYFLATFVGLPSLLLVAAALALSGAMEVATVAASLGVAGGAIGALAAPWIYARRKHLR